MRSALEPDVRWRPGASAARAALSLGRLPRQDICHAHMTIAETVALLTRPVPPRAGCEHAAFRGAQGLEPCRTRRGAVDRQAARPRDRGQRLRRVAPRACSGCRHPQRRSAFGSPVEPWEPGRPRPSAPRVGEGHVGRRCEPGDVRLADEGWTLRVVGDGSERAALQRFAATERLPRVEFAHWTSDVAGEFARAAILLATAPGEPFGLTVAEAMAAGVPVVASAAGAISRPWGASRVRSCFRPATPLRPQPRWARSARRGTPCRVRCRPRACLRELHDPGCMSTHCSASTRRSASVRPAAERRRSLPG